MAPPAVPPIRFENTVELSKVTFALDNSVTPNKHQIETMIAGVAVLDFDNDGWLDLYFLNGARLPAFDKSDPGFWNRLYRNNRDGTFTDVTEKAGVRGAGYGMGVAVADYDNDGWQDIYVASINHNQLFHNNGDGTFADVTAKVGVAGIHSLLGKTWAIGAGWFDYDNDGLLDLFVVTYVKWSIETEPPCTLNRIRAYCAPDSYEGLPNMLFRNNGDGTFTDVSAKSGIGKHVGKGMGVAFADYDGDGWTDAFVSNDSYRNFLFRNQGNGTFSEEAIPAGVAYNENGKSIAGMGCDFRDVDNDGRPDIFVVAMAGDTFPLFLNRPPGFLDITASSGISRITSTLTAWGSGIVDFDNDGWKDLFASTAAILDNSEEIEGMPSKLPPLAVRNIGGKRFVNVSREAGGDFQIPHRHRGVAFGDLNNDGRIDAVITNQHQKPDIFMNRGAAGNHWLMFELAGRRSNRDGIAAKIKVVAGAQVQHNHGTTSVGYGCSSDRRVHFGLGAAAKADMVEITWPSGLRQVLQDVPADRVVKVAEGK